jgi:hypothetical protein
MIHSDSFTVSYSWYSIHLICQICEARDWGSGTVYSFECSEGEMEQLAVLISRAEGHWNQIHANKEDED